MLNLDDDEIGTIKLFVQQAQADQVTALISDNLSSFDEPDIEFVKKTSKAGIEIDVACIEVQDVYSASLFDPYTFLVDAKIPAIIIITNDGGKEVLMCTAKSYNPSEFQISAIDTVSWFGVCNAAERLADEAQDLEGFKKAFAEYRDSFTVDFGLLINQETQMAVDTALQP